MTTNDTDAYIGLTPGAVEEWPAEHRDLAFTREEYLGRIRRLRARMADQKIDLLYITAPDHVAYLHGYVASWYKTSSPMRYPQLYGTAIHVDFDDFIHFDNPTELPVLGKTSVSSDNRFFPSRDAGPCLAFIVSELKAKGWLGGTVGLEHWSYLPNRAIGTMLEGAFLAEGCRTVDASALVRRLRLVKSPAEIAKIRHVCQTVSEAFEALPGKLRIGDTEREACRKLRLDVLERGMDGAPYMMGCAGPGGYDNIIMGPRDRVIEKGDMVCFDTDLIGPYGYCADISRAWVAGAKPTEEQRTIYQLAVEQIRHNTALLKAGVTFREVSEKAWPIPELYQAGRYGSLIHGIGLCDEFPSIKHWVDFETKGYDGVLQEDMTLCVESYIGAAGGREGVKLEEQVRITRDGVEQLSSYPLDAELMAG